MKKLFEKKSGFSFFSLHTSNCMVPFLIFEFSGILPGEHRGRLGFGSSSVVRSGRGK